MHSQELANSLLGGTRFRDLPQQHRVKEDRASLLSVNSGPLQETISIKYVILKIFLKNKENISV